LTTVIPPRVDTEAGMMVYATPGPRHLGRLRVTHDDFSVSEIFDTSQIEPVRKGGYVPVYRVKKRGIDTPHAAEELAAALKSRVNFAGLKDSNAVTVQYASARSSRASDPVTVTGSRFEAERVGYLPRPLTRAMMTGNRFEIAISSDEDLASSVTEVYASCAGRSTPNFFGYQRFGLRGMVNHRIGAAVVRRDFERATALLLGETRRDESPEVVEARRLSREGMYREALAYFSRRQDLERKVAAHLADRPDDHLGAIRRIPITLRRLLVQAYQSYLFNLTLSRAILSHLDIASAEAGDNWAETASHGLGVMKVHGVKEQIAGDAVPLIQLVGYAFRDYGSRFDRILVSILEEEGVKPSWFYLKEADEFSNEGGFRHAPLLVGETAQAVIEAEAEEEKKQAGRKTRLTFSLGRGEYATTLLRELLKPEDPLAAGF
jgi:tRNA pseudouridine13 synthase